MKTLAILFALFFTSTAYGQVCTQYAAPDGLATNTGTFESPYSLTRVGTGATASPGDVICLRGGTYKGRFTFNISGSAASPVTIRPYLNERVVIDAGYPSTTVTVDIPSAPAYSGGTINVADTSQFAVQQVIRIGSEQMQIGGMNATQLFVARGWNGTCSDTGTCNAIPSGAEVRLTGSIVHVNSSHLIMRNLEITNTGHITRIRGSQYVDDGIGLVDNCTAGCKFINNVIHNTGGGIGSFNSAQGSEFYGNIVFFNGYINYGGSPGGHGIYVQNTVDSPSKFISDNLSFMNFSFNFQAYTDNGGLDNLNVIGNSFFANSNMTGLTPSFNFLIGGGTAFKGFKFLTNSTYNYAGAGTTVIGWAGTPCTTPEIRDNYVASGFWELGFGCTNPIVTGNVFATQNVTGQTYPSNTYYGGHPTSGKTVIVRGNAYEVGRGHITIFNWDRSPSVVVFLDNLGLAIGQAYEIRDSQNIFGIPVVSGVYDGNPVSIPMTGTAVSPIYGTVPLQPSHTSEEFGSFVVIPVGSVTPTPTPTPVPTPTPTPVPTPTATPTPTPTPVTVVSVSGRVIDGSAGARGARLAFRTNGTVYSVTTNGFGYYTVSIPANLTYTVSVKYKNRTFQTRTLTPTGDVTNFDFVAN
jgi:hypothetical protein